MLDYILRKVREFFKDLSNDCAYMGSRYCTKKICFNCKHRVTNLRAKKLECFGKAETNEQLEKLCQELNLADLSESDGWEKCEPGFYGKYIKNTRRNAGHD